jgi:hypothetical protein
MWEAAYLRGFSKDRPKLPVALPKVNPKTPQMGLFADALP